MWCVVEGCTRRVKSREFCARHYKRWLKYGDPNYLSRQPPAIPVVGRNVPDDRNTMITRYLVKSTHEEQTAWVQRILDERMGK